MEEKNPYADIIHLPHHQAANRPHMSLYDRAAQFSPYAALVGYDDMVRETARVTDCQLELGEAEKQALDQKLALLADMVEDGRHPAVTVVYFIPDALKAGGAYEEFTGAVKKVDAVERQIVFLAANGRSSGKSIGMDAISQIHGELIDDIDGWTGTEKYTSSTKETQPNVHHG